MKPETQHTLIITIIIIWLFVLTVVVGTLVNKNRLYKDALGNETA